MVKYFCILIFFLTYTKQLLAQDEEKPFIQTDTITIIKKTQIVGIPIVFYTPETDFGFGGGAQLIFGDMKNVFNSRLSDMLVTAVYTTKGQLLIDARPKIHVYNGQYYLEGILRYKLFPNSFWGIGSSTPDNNLEQYNMESIEVNAQLLKRIPPDLNFGFEYMFNRHKMLEYDANGMLVDSVILGSAGATISALAVIFNYDNRDNIFSTKKGNYILMNAGFCSRVLGANFSYNKYKIDFRKYFLLNTKLTMAVQYYMEVSYGEVPFQNMAWLGGGERTRGYFKGRYIDNQFYAIQGELRWRIAPRLILAGFISGGEVADYISNLYNDLKYSYGGGVRFQMTKKSPVLVRLDIGIGRQGNSGVYFGVNEAF